MDSIDTSWEKEAIYQRPNEIQSGDSHSSQLNSLIFVLAGGLKENGNVHDFVAERLDKACELYQQQEHKSVIICLGGGTYHKPPHCNSDGYVIHESTACAQYLYSKGVPESAIFREWASYDTIANGYYAFTNFIVPMNTSCCTLITSSFHMPRTMLIFNYFKKLYKSSCKLHFIETSNRYLTSAVLQVRQEREHRSAIQFEQLTKRINSIRDFISWLHTEHNAYKSLVHYVKNDSKLASSY